MDGEGVPWGSRPVRSILASTLVLPLGVPLLSPALPLLRDAFGLTDAGAGLVVTVYFLPGVVLSPAVGSLVGRAGRRRVLVAGLLGFGLAGAGIALAADFGTVLALRLVQGVGAAAIIVSTVTYLADSFEGVRRNAVLGANVAVLFAGAAIYPPAGGVLAGGGWNAPFVAYLLALPVALAAFRGLDPAPAGRPIREPGSLRALVAALPAARAAGAYGAALLVEVLSFGAILTGLPFLLATAYGLAPLRIGLIVTGVTAAAALAGAANGRAARHARNGTLIAAGFVGCGVGLLGIAIAPAPRFVAAAGVAFGVGMGLVLPSVDAAISGLAPAGRRADALSLRGSATFLGRSVGPLAFTGIAAVSGYRPLLLAAGVATLAGGLGGVLRTIR